MSKTFNRDGLDEMFGIEREDETIDTLLDDFEEDEGIDIEMLSPQAYCENKNTEIIEVEGVEEDTSEDTSEDLDNYKFGDPKAEEEDYTLASLKDMISDIKSVIEAAKFLVDSSPDAESVTAAGALFSSAASLLRELNKGVLQAKKQYHEQSMEKYKVKAREKLVKLKADLSKNKLYLGQGNTINVQNNNYNEIGQKDAVPFNQSDIISEILEQKQPKNIEEK